MPDGLRSRAKGFFWRALVMLAVGGAAFFALETIDSSLLPLGGQTPTLQPSEAPLAADAPELPRTTILDRRGDEYVARAIEALAGLPSLAANVTQEGRLAGGATTLTGRYAQKSSGESLRFALQVEGRLVGRTARLTRISDSRFLWTDLQWAPEDPSAGPEPTDRLIRRVDLRRVRREAEGQGGAADSRVIAERFGGLPMLLCSLDREYDFAAPRRMQLDGVPVLAMVGQRGVAPTTGETLLPHHVVLAIEEATLAVRLVEYRSANDPLAASNLPPEERLRPSTMPLLRIRYSNLQAAVAIDDAAFVYTRPDDLPWRDETQRALRLVRSAVAEESVATRPTPRADAARR